ncbi:MAG: dinitrogenase iron-molybdenum cofactor biosynthesis protein [Deltaproteobacteria bacterium]|nr:dinitrogenase iron-molybdenum cofactor biosynthesis protein [Deltaproteobacteria bacterium]
MKVCITSKGPGLDSEMDPRFGRCQYFLFVDLETLGCEAVENPNIGAAGGAGIQSAQLVANKGVEALITGQVGPNAFTTLQAAGIKILTGASGKVREVLDKYQKGQISSSAQGPTVRAHFGMGRGRGMGVGFQPPAPSPATPDPPGEELKALKKQSQELREQLDKITERLEKLDTKK